MKKKILKQLINFFHKFLIYIDKYNKNRSPFDTNFKKWGGKRKRKKGKKEK